MDVLALGLCGRLELAIRNRDGAIKRFSAHNHVLRAGRSFIAGALIGHPSDLHFAVAIGADGTANHDDLTDLVQPIKCLKVIDPALKDEAVVLQASYDPPASIKVAESGLVLNYRSVGSGNKRLTILYNRAVLDPAAVVEQGETLTLTWTLSFLPITA